MASLARAISDASALKIAIIILAVAFATIAGAWAFEAIGYLPCELCLKQRWAYYAEVPLAALCVLAAASGQRVLTAIGFALVAVIFLGSAGFGAYHAGVEWGFWQGPTDCTGSLNKAASMQDFMNQLQTVKVVRCDAVAIRIIGLSLAGWNAVISLGLACLGAIGARRSISG